MEVEGQRDQNRWATNIKNKYKMFGANCNAGLGCHMPPIFLRTFAFHAQWPCRGVPAFAPDAC
eukprot:2969067-Amphidinium_carterae.4